VRRPAIIRSLFPVCASSRAALVHWGDLGELERHEPDAAARPWAAQISTPHPGMIARIRVVTVWSDRLAEPA
jgi:hypothetical protein